MQVSTVSIVVNLLLSVFKLLAGIIGKSGAMVSDAIHSASDVFSSFIVIIGVSLAGKESDEGHQYGHDRLECVAAIILAVVLLITGAGIGIDGVNKIINGTWQSNNSGNNSNGCSNYIYCNKGMDVLVYKICCKKD